MSFSSDTKKELCKIENKRDCCIFAQGYGLLLFSKVFSVRDRAVKTENSEVARALAEYAAVCAGVITEVSVRYHRGSKEAYSFSVDGTEQRKQLISSFNHHPHEITLRINRDNIENECCMAAFLRGVFITCGLVTDPQKEYHLEFILPYKGLAADLAELLKELPTNPEPSMSERGGNYVIYIKDSGKIEDLLTYIGASNASMELMQIKMYKEALNDINRKSNFETANMDKTYSASAKQTAAIAVIADTAGLSSLSDDLRQVAVLRLHNPEMTLKEMAEALHISRSGVNHRIQKLMAIAEKAGKSIKEIIYDKEN